jgi:hypothetical protein
MPDRDKGFDAAGFVADLFSQPFVNKLGEYFTGGEDPSEGTRAREVQAMQDVANALGYGPGNWPGWTKIVETVRENHEFATLSADRVMADDAFVRGVRELLGMRQDSHDELLAGVKAIIDNGTVIENQNDQLREDERAFHAALFEIAQAVGGLDPVHDELEPDAVVASVHDIVHGSKAKTDTHAKLFDDLQDTNRRLNEVADERNRLYGYLLELVRDLGENFSPGTIGDGVDAARTAAQNLQANLGERWSEYRLGLLKPQAAEERLTPPPHIALMAGDVIRVLDDDSLGVDPYVAVSYALADKRWVFTMLSDPYQPWDNDHLTLRAQREEAFERVQDRNAVSPPQADVPVKVLDQRDPPSLGGSSLTDVMGALIDETFGRYSQRAGVLRKKLGITD